MYYFYKLKLLCDVKIFDDYKLGCFVEIETHIFNVYFYFNNNNNLYYRLNIFTLLLTLL